MDISVKLTPRIRS